MSLIIQTIEYLVIAPLLLSYYNTEHRNKQHNDA